MHMKHFAICSVAALALATLAALAPAGAQQRGPEDPRAAVPETRYQPAHPYRPAPDVATTPDRQWRALNETVAGLDSMSLTMPDAHAGHGALAPQAQPGKQHGQHHDGQHGQHGQHGQQGQQGQHDGHAKGHH